MPNPSTLPRAELERLDRLYRDGGLRTLAIPLVHYDRPECPHPGCERRMEWIDFKRVDEPLVRSWWDGTGFAGRCPLCHGWVRFTTLGMTACGDEEPHRLPRLPDDWAAVAQIA